MNLRKLLTEYADPKQLELVAMIFAVLYYKNVLDEGGLVVRAVGELQATLMFKRKVQGPEDPTFQELMQDAVVIGGACMYYKQLVQQGRQPEYFGETVTPEDADAVLMRWKLENGSMRVVYGDLRLETLSGSE